MFVENFKRSKTSKKVRFRLKRLKSTNRFSIKFRRNFWSDGTSTSTPLQIRLGFDFDFEFAVDSVIIFLPNFGGHAARFRRPKRRSQTKPGLWFGVIRRPQRWLCVSLYPLDSNPFTTCRWPYTSLANFESEPDANSTRIDFEFESDGNSTQIDRELKSDVNSTAKKNSTTKI